MARDALTRSGVAVRGLSADEVLTRAMSTSDFPILVSNAMGKVAAQAYQAASSPLKVLSRQRVLPNFKESTSIRLGEMGRLEELTESGEFTHTSRAENGESMSITIFGRGVNVTRKLIVNDELNLLGDMTAAFGEAGAATEADLLVDLLTSNPNLSDGNPVFGTARGNKAATGAALSVATVDTARKAMRGVNGLDGKTLVAVQPKYLLVGPEIETEPDFICPGHGVDKQFKRQAGSRFTIERPQPLQEVGHVCRPQRGHVAGLGRGLQGPFQVRGRVSLGPICGDGKPEDCTDLLP